MACVIAAGLAFANSVIRAAMAAEESYQTFFRAYNPTIEYVKLNSGNWPASWDDLASIEPSVDYEWVAEHIEYDFGANPKELARLTPETFDAIKNKNPYYDFGREIESLIEILRKHHK